MQQETLSLGRSLAISASHSTLRPPRQLIATSGTVAASAEILELTPGAFRPTSGAVVIGDDALPGSVTFAFARRCRLGAALLYEEDEIENGTLLFRREGGAFFGDTGG
ncbi:MAG: hypothetical protein ACR2II_04240 [Chthoniobacterales bacterium]